MDLPGLGWHTLPTMAAVCNAKAGLHTGHGKFGKYTKSRLFYCIAGQQMALYCLPSRVKMKKWELSDGFRFWRQCP